MNYLMLGCEIEYEQAAKRLEELSHAQPGSCQAQERKELLRLFVQFERDMNERDKMEGSKDYVLENLDIESLERKKVQEYLCYVIEKARLPCSPEEKIKLVDYGVKLTRRLVDIDCTRVSNLTGVVSENYKGMKLIRTKHHLVW